MAFTGTYYNNQDSVEALVQPTATFSTTSKPLTLLQVEVINKGIYRQINSMLKAKGIDIDELTEEDQETLSLINDYGTASRVEYIRYGKAKPNRSEKGDVWNELYKEGLDLFIEGKVQLSNASQVNRFGTGLGIIAGTDITDGEESFKRDDEY